MKCDRIDKKMLAELQRDGRLSIVDLADRVGLSVSPCLRRLKRLEAEGVIAGYRAVLDRTRIGLGLLAFVGIKVERHDDAERTAFEAAVAAIPEVVACHIISGAEADFLLQLMLPDLAAYERFLLDTLLKLPGVKDVRSSFALRTVKAPSPLPLGALAS